METPLPELKLKVLYEIGQIIGQALNLDQALEKVLKILGGYLSMKKATITLKDGKTGHLRISACHGLGEEEKSRGIYCLNERITSRIFRTVQPFVVPEVRKEPFFLNKTKSRPLDKRQISFIGVPIILQGSPIGVLSVDRLFGEEVSVEEDIQFLSIVALLIGLAGQSSALLEIQRLVNRMAQELQSSLFPAGEQIDTEDYPSCLKKIEKREILRALERNHWIQSQAARELGLTLRQIGYRLKQFGLDKMVKEHRRQVSGVGQSIRGYQAGPHPKNLTKSPEIA
jgi:transcriptional regulator with GAF, ATPase, and Fis domain